MINLFMKKINHKKWLTFDIKYDTILEYEN